MLVASHPPSIVRAKPELLRKKGSCQMAEL